MTIAIQCVLKKELSSLIIQQQAVRSPGRGFKMRRRRLSLWSRDLKEGSASVDTAAPLVRACTKQEQGRKSMPRRDRTHSIPTRLDGD